MSIFITPYDEQAHRAPIIEMLERVRSVDPTYPSPKDTDASPESLRRWLGADGVIGRWVAEIDGAVVGHVLIEEALPYLREHFVALDLPPSKRNGYAEIGKLFADPQVSKHGVGGTLLRHAIASAWGSAYHPALAVVETSTKAVSLYRRSELVETPSFVGRHGVNQVFRGASAPAF